MKISGSPYLNKNTEVLFATFSRYEKGVRLPTNGMVEPMLAYFVPKVRTFTLIDQPHPVSDTISPIVEIYRSGKLVKKYILPSWTYLPIYLYCLMERTGLTRLSYKLRDVCSVLIVALTERRKYDLFIGLEGANVLAGLLLKKLGKVRKVTYYVSDYSPNRFSKYGKKILNTIYVLLDRFCVKHADFTWDVSPAMLKGRISAGLKPLDGKRVINVPNGLFSSQIKSLPPEKRNQNYLVYLGILDPDMGPDLAIRALVEVLKDYPKITLQIIGGTKEDIRVLEKLVTKLHLGKSVFFHGFIKDNEAMASLVRKCYIGLAPYRSFPESIRWYGDAGKIRQYLASGLPIVTTNVPPLGRFVAEKGAALMTKDNVSDFSGTILKLLRDENLYEQLSQAAIKLARNNTWNNSYNSAFEKMTALKNKII